jgi:hypothetical protein
MISPYSHFSISLDFCFLFVICYSLFTLASCCFYAVVFCFFLLSYFCQVVFKLGHMDLEGNKIAHLSKGVE